MNSIIKVKTTSEDNEIFLISRFAAEIANFNTRKAYGRACFAFRVWLEEHEITLLNAGPLHIATWREVLLETHSIATVKLQLAALRAFYDWLRVHHYVMVNSASSVKSPRESVAVGKTTFLDQREASLLLHSIDISSVIGLRDRALIGLMLFTFARIGAALALKCSDLTERSGSTWVLLHEKGGKIHEMPLHRQAETWVREYLTVVHTEPEKDQFLFRSVDRRTGLLSDRKLHPANAYEMVKKRARAAGISTPVCNHTFRATGITAYLVNGGSLEAAAKLANHASTRTTQLYDRRSADIKMAEVQRISF